MSRKARAVAIVLDSPGAIRCRRSRPVVRSSRATSGAPRDKVFVHFVARCDHGEINKVGARPRVVSGGRGATAPPVGVHACTTRRWDLRRLREASRGAQSGHSRLEGRVRRAFLGERQAASLTLQERSTDGAGFLTGVRGTCGWAGRR